MTDTELRELDIWIAEEAFRVLVKFEGQVPFIALHGLSQWPSQGEVPHYTTDPATEKSRCIRRTRFRLQPKPSRKPSAFSPNSYFRQCPNLDGGHYPIFQMNQFQTLKATYQTTNDSFAEVFAGEYDLNIKEAPNTVTDIGAN